MRVSLCASCHPQAGGLGPALQAALAKAGVAAVIGQVDCMSGCTRPATIAFRATGKTAYLFGDITEADLADLLVFAKAYAASETGDFADARLLGELRHKAIARIPG